MKRISVDCRSLETVCGVAVYTRELLQALIPMDAQNHYQLLLRKKSSYPDVGPNLTKRVLRLPGRLTHFFWKRWRVLPMDLFLGGTDVFFSPNFTLPHLRPRVRTVITVHDLAFLKMPEDVTDASNAFLGYWVADSIRRADRIIAVSQSTKRDIVRHFDVPADRIVVVHSACSTRFRPLPRGASAGAALRAKYGLPEKFILAHGTLEPRKNISFLLKSFAAARSKLGGTKLVISGKRGWLFESIFATVTELGLSEDVCFPGFIEDEDLPRLYNECEFFCCVSKYEGFGLPVVEAMACGKAVIVSDVSSLPEVVADAGIRIDPTDSEALSRAMVRLATNRAERETLEGASLRRAAAFAWTTAARETLAVLESVAGVETAG